MTSPAMVPDEGADQSKELKGRADDAFRAQDFQETRHALRGFGCNDRNKKGKAMSQGWFWITLGSCSAICDFVPRIV